MAETASDLPSLSGFDFVVNAFTTTCPGSRESWRIVRVALNVLLQSHHSEIWLFDGNPSLAVLAFSILSLHATMSTFTAHTSRYFLHKLAFRLTTQITGRLSQPSMR